MGHREHFFVSREIAHFISPADSIIVSFLLSNWVIKGAKSLARLLLVYYHDLLGRLEVRQCQLPWALSVYVEIIQSV